jgi:dTDP-glucose pyrophosphorylase
MTAFVIVAAGRGSRLGRIGDVLPKPLVPLRGQALLSHQFALAPDDARLVVVVGYRADVIRDYVKLAHPGLNVTFVEDRGWGRGPGASLLAAYDELDGDSFYWIASDTLCNHASSNEVRDLLDERETSWLGVAPVPAGTPPQRWCRVVTHDDDGPGSRYVSQILDKSIEPATHATVSTAFGYVAGHDVYRFWNGLREADVVAGELQFSAGLQAIVDAGSPLVAREIDWLDVGDEAALRRANADAGSYDTVKPGQATYLLPSYDRVVKFNADPTKVLNRISRGQQLGAVAPPCVGSSLEFAAYPFVDGSPIYDELQLDFDLDLLLTWWADNFWTTRYDEVPTDSFTHITRFYRDKTLQRVEQLNEVLRPTALDAVLRVDWEQLAAGAVFGEPHGDLTFANVIRRRDGQLVAIDWREDFGEHTWGDLRYDLGKMYGGTLLHWRNAARGDFRYWPRGRQIGYDVLSFADSLGINERDVQTIGALTLINSAPLHAPPLDEILVARGTRLLEKVT